MVRTNQGGSVLSFVVIGVIMALLLVGGAFVVRQQVAGPDHSQGAMNKGDTKQTEKSENQDKKATAQPKNKEGAAAQPSPGADSLPQSGPVGVLGSLVAFGLLSGVIVAYVRSRRLDLSF